MEQASTGSGEAGAGQVRQETPARRGSRPALPVAVEIAEPVGAAVRSWCEGGLGWQVVAETDGDPVPPLLRLVDPSTSAVGRSSASGPDGPGDRALVVLLVPEGTDPLLAAEAVHRRQPAEVCSWPRDRELLADIADRLLRQRADDARDGGVPTLVVGGSAGGVGTTTIALALGGLRAWSGTRTLVAVRGAGLQPRAVPTEALGAGDLWAAADPRAGIDGLRAVRLADHGPLPEVIDPSVGSLVLDAGVETAVDVLVCRLDRAGAEALDASGAAVVVVVGQPVLPARAVRDLLAGRPAVAVPWSARVARAGLRDRVPADLPGPMLKALSAATPGGVRGTPVRQPRARRERDDTTSPAAR